MLLDCSALVRVVCFYAYLLVRVSKVLHDRLLACVRTLQCFTVDRDRHICRQGISLESIAAVSESV